MVRRKIAHTATVSSAPRKRRSWVQKRYPRVRALQAFLRRYGGGEDGREGRLAFAKRLGTTPSYLVHLGLGNRRASMELAIRIEQESHGQVKCEDMLPSAEWHYLEQRGRPRSTGGTNGPTGSVSALAATS